MDKIKFETDTAKILLHCQRFAEPATRALLAKSYQKVTYLMNDADYAAWLK